MGSRDFYGNLPKVVTKPWGKEEWLHLDNNYCYKRLEIKKGTRTSLQYHENKVETNYVISGEAEFWLENDAGDIEKKVCTPGIYVTVKPLRKHRVVALTDLVLLEASTPYVDDVIRVNDDYKRPDGKIESEHTGT